MAVEKTIKINADTGDFDARIKAIETALGKMADAQADANEETAKQTKAINEQNDELKNQSKLLGALKGAAKGAKKGVAVLGKGFKGLGLAMKATGVLLIVEGFNLLKDALMSNQKIMDQVEKVTNAIGIVMGTIAEAIATAYNNVSEMNGGFDAMKEVIGSLMTIALQPLIISLNTLKLGVLQVQKAYERWFGNNDAEKIAEINAEIDATSEKIIEAGKTIVTEAVDIAANIGEAVGEVIQGVTAIVDATTTAVKNIDTDKVMDDADRMVELRKQAEQSEVNMGKIAAKYAQDIAKATAERDKENQSLKKREEQQKIIDALTAEQLEKEKEQLKIQLANLKAISDMTGLDEDRIAYQEKLTEIAEKTAEITQSGYDSAAENDALAQERRDLESEARNRQIELRQIELDLESELLLKESEKLNAQKLAISEIADLRIADLEAQMVGLDAESELYKQFADEKVQIQAEANAEIDTLERDSVQLRKDLRLELEESVLDIATNGFDALTALSELYAGEDESRAKRAFDIQKRLAQGQAIVGTYQAIVGALKAEGADGLLPFPVRLANSIVAGVAGFAQVAQIGATQFEGGGSTSEPNIPTAPQRSPSFNVVGSSGINQLAQSMGEKEPVKAYVVGSDVSSQQELDRKKLSNASFG